MPPPAKQPAGGAPSNPQSLPTTGNTQGPNYVFPNPANPTSTTSYAAVDFRKDFFFRRRHGALDWRKLQQIDLEKVVRTVDVDALQDNVEHITFADISEHDLAQLTDANFLQLFRMTQLIIEYLLNVQNFLLASAKKKEATYEQVVAELNATRAELAERTESERAARREAKYQKKIIRAYERNLGARWSELGGNQAGAVNSAPSKCGICGSVFVNHEFLVGHYRRRHPGEPLPSPTIVASNTAATNAGKASAEEKGQTTDLAAWKKEMESALRAQILDQNRMRSALVPEETETSQRLAKLEATLSAVLNGNTVPITSASSPSGEKKESHVSGLRDDDGGERMSDDQANIKEYLRRQLFDLHEEIRALKQHQQHHPHSSTHAHHQHTALTLGDHLSPRSEAHASELMHRFRPSTTLQPHAPAYPHHTHNIPHGHGGVVPRHVPGQTPSSQQQLQPHPPAAPSKAAVPVSNADPATMQALRTSLIKHQDVKYELFPDLPGLLARFIQSEQELVSNLNSFAVISNTLALQGEGTGSGIEIVESELRAQGYDSILPDIESFVDEYVKSHYKRPVELLEAHRAIAAREAKNEALGVEEKAQAEKERKQREQWAAQVAEMESQRTGIEKSRQDEARRIAQAREENLRIAQKEAQESAERLARAHEKNIALLSNQTNAPTPSPTAPAIAADAATPGTPASGPVGAPTPAAAPAASTPSIGPVKTPVVAAANTPLAVPSKLPSAAPSPLMPSTSATSLAPAAAPDSIALPPASASGLSTLQQRQLQAAPVSFSNNPNILNPSAAGSSSGLPPTVPRQGSLATKQPPVGILKKTNTVRALVPSGIDADDDDDFEEEKVPFNPPISNVSTAAAAATAPSFQRAASLSTRGVTAPLPAGSPMAVPVPIPARPNKAAVAASLAANTPSAAAVAGTKPLDANTVEAFNNAAQENASNSVSMASIPSGFSTPPVVQDSLLMRRTETRRLGGDQGGPPEKDPMDNSLDLLKRDHRGSEGVGSNFMASALAQINAGNRRGSGTDVAGGAIVGGGDTEKIEYEHSTARRDQEGGEEDGGLDVYARDREELEARNRDNVQAFGEDDVHHFSPPVTSPLNRTRGVSGTGRLHSDDEGDTPVQPVAARFANAGVGAPPSRTRHVASPTNGPIGSNAPAVNSRLLQPPVNRSAQFSVTNSSDWKSDNDILDDDVEEVFV